MAARGQQSVQSPPTCSLIRFHKSTQTLQTRDVALTFALESQLGPFPVQTLHNSQPLGRGEVSCTAVVDLLPRTKGAPGAVLLHQGGVRVLGRCRAGLLGCSFKTSNNPSFNPNKRPKRVYVPPPFLPEAR